MQSPEVRLWLAVIERAVLDACGVVEGRRDKEEGLRERDKARAWLLGNSSDFRLVCDLALLEPAFVYGKALKLQARGWTVRRGPINRVYPPSKANRGQNDTVIRTTGPTQPHDVAQCEAACKAH